MIAELRDYLVAEGIVRAPDQPGAGARPWLPPAWKHPDDGPIGPGDAEQANKAPVTHDDGLVLSLMIGVGIPPGPGEESRRRDAVDLVMRGNAVPAIAALDVELRDALLGRPAYPGGKVDWVMGGLYVIQSQQSAPFAPVGSSEGVYTFRTSYLFELWA